MKRRLTAALAALALAGCGGNDEPEPEATPQATEREVTKQPTDQRPNLARFIKKADEICARFNDRWVGIPEATPEYYRDWRESNADLEALDVPAEISKEWKKYLDALEQQRRFTKGGKGAELKQAYERKEKAAQEIGFSVCRTG